jgi:inosine/xanthosine triphosphatase
MIFAIGSENQAKLKACHQAVKKVQLKYPGLFLSKVEFTAIKAQSSVSDMPLTQNEILNGARNRAFFTYKNLKENNPVDFAIGMEGGVYLTKEIDQKSDQAILQNWVYIYNGQKGYFGCSAGIPLPPSISRPLFEQNIELAEVIDNASGQEDVRSKNGAFGILTNDLYTRSDAFEQAVINALIPFFNTNYY